MNRRRLPIAGRILLATILAAFVAACGGGQPRSTSQPGVSSTSPAAGTGSPGNGAQQGTPVVHPGTTPAAVTVPQVSGDSAQIAEQKVSGLGLGFVTAAEPNLNYSANVVIATSPPEGAAAQTGNTITLYVSQGAVGCGNCARLPLYRVMPDVCGQTYQQANATLAQSGITLGDQVVSQASSAPAGVIIGSDPTAGTNFVAYGPVGFDPEQVTVTISSGPGASSASGSSPSCSAPSAPSGPSSSSPGMPDSPSAPS